MIGQGSALGQSIPAPPGSRLCSRRTVASDMFLAKKVDQLLNQVNNLSSLPNQHALLLLGTCLQQDLRHLQRSLSQTPTIEAEWAKLDQGVWDEVRKLRGRASDRQGNRIELEDALMSLPLRMGGMVLLYLHPATLFSTSPS